MMQLSEELLTPEHIERLKKQDPRFNVLDVRLRIEQELRDSLCLKIILEAAGEQAAEALEALAEVDPSELKKIISLQAIVQRARFIARTLNKAIRQGEIAEQSLSEEQAIELNDELGGRNVNGT